MLSLFRNRLATPTLFDPTFEPWSDLRREIDRVFDSAMSSGSGIGRQMTDGFWTPPMDVVEHNDVIYLSVELPGVDPRDVNITLENSVFSITGEKKYQSESAQDANVFFERRYGRFERNLTLLPSIDAEKITARYKNGVLHLELPKSADARRKKIAIGVEAGEDQKQISSGDKPGKIA